MTIKVGDPLPPATFTTMTPNGPQPVDAADFFRGKRVALFSVPGAFTPTCSAKHLPGFVERADEILSAGIDAIACTAVNDVFVMDAWGREGGVTDKITLLADGNGDFARAIDMEMDGSKFGMGMRSKRYAMIVDDGTVERIDVEGPGEFRVSSADYMIEQLTS